MTFVLPPFCSSRPPKTTYSTFSSSSSIVLEARAEGSSDIVACTASRLALYTNACRSAPVYPSVALAIADRSISGERETLLTTDSRIYSLAFHIMNSSEA
jgi:hypothetical protein